MNTAVLMIAGLATAATGYWLAVRRGGRGEGFKGGGLTGHIPVFFIASQTAYYSVSVAQWPAVLTATLIAAGVLMPLAVLAEKRYISSPTEFKIARHLSLLVLFAAVFKGLTANGLSPIIVLCFAIVGAVYKALVDKIGKTPAIAVSNIIAVSALFTYFMIPSTTFTSDITLIVAIIVMYFVGTFSVQNLEKFKDALTPLHTALLIVFIAAVLYSPFSHVNTPDAELRPDGVFSIMPLVFLAFFTTGSAAVSRLFEASLLSLAVSIAAIGGAFSTASAQLLTPLVGEPVKGLTARVVQAVLQLMGLSALTMIFSMLSKNRPAVSGMRIQAALTYGVPAVAIGLALSMSAVEQAMFLAGSINMITFSLMLANMGGVYLIAAAFFFLLAFNTLLLQTLLQASAMFSLAPFIPIIISLAAVGLGVWVFSSAVVAWLRRR